MSPQSEQKPPYESPSKKQLEEALEKIGPWIKPELKANIESAIAEIDHTNPQDILQRLPEPVLEFYRHTVVRAHGLTPLIKNAVEAHCYIESIILSHGLIQFALRGLYVLAWQRALLPTALSAHELAPYYKPGSRRGDVSRLIEDLEKSGLIYDVHAAHLRSINDDRNRAAHGVIFGEMSSADLEESALKAQHGANGALQRLQAWFNNPQPLRGVGFQPKTA